MSEKLLAAGKPIPAVWCAKSGKSGYYWNSERGTFRSSLTFIGTGKRILTGLVKPIAKFEVLEQNDFGTGVIGYLVHGLRAKRVMREAKERQTKADAQRQTRKARKARRERERVEAEARTVLNQVGILPALFTLNRAAKRHRDKAKTLWKSGLKKSAGEAAAKKRGYYEVKGHALARLIAEGTLVRAGYHKFPNGHFAEVLAGQGYRFHRPAEVPETEAFEQIGEIESKPPGAGEVDESLAVKAVRGFLLGWEKTELYEWPERERGGSDDEDSLEW